MRRAVGRRLVVVRAARRAKITDRFQVQPKVPAPREDEDFFRHADVPAEEALLASLEREQRALDEKEAMAAATPEWQQYGCSAQRGFAHTPSLRVPGLSRRFPASHAVAVRSGSCGSHGGLGERVARERGAHYQRG